MATFTIIQINGDHIGDCDADTLGYAIKNAVSNPYNFRRYAEEHSEIGRAINYIGTTGEKLRIDEIKREYWLQKGE